MNHRLSELLFATSSAFAVVMSLAMSASADAQAPLYICRNNGVVEYNNSPASAKDKNCEVKPMPQITTIPAPPAAKSSTQAGAAKSPNGNQATASSTPGNFPRVDPNTQKARDSDRAAILESEKRREQAKLQELKAEFNNGEPERRGDERNYQKYLDRVEKLKEDIQRSESNIKSLDRELQTIRG